MFRLHALFGSLLLLVPTLLGPIDGKARRCSLAVVVARSATETLLLATASPDTFVARPVDVAFGRLGVEYLVDASRGPVYGQLVTIARFGGADSARLERAFQERSDKHAVIVPWDYDASCSAARWNDSAAWVRVGEPGSFTVRLRPDSLWVEGLPVFDAFFARLEPYPSGQVYEERWYPSPEYRTNPELSAEQHFDLLSSMPTTEDQQATPDSAWRMFLRWQGANPELAGLYPANHAAVTVAANVSSAKSTRVLRSIEPVIAGTYRISASLDGSTDRTFYVRTRPRPNGEWRTNVPRVPADPLEEPPRPEAYNVLASGASSLESLSKDCARARAPSREGYMYVIDPPRTDGERRTEWRGWIEVDLVARQFQQDSALVRFSRQQFDEWAERWSTAAALEAPARFWLGDDGVLRVEQTIRLRDGQSLLLRGERVSNDVIACEW